MSVFWKTNPKTEGIKEADVELSVMRNKDATFGEFLDFFGGIVPVICETRSAEECVNKCAELAVAGDTVLLSPCCASFDLFKNYEDRGRQFKDAVRRL